MNKKTVGRKTKLSENEVKRVIKLFKEHDQPNGIIKYADIHRFANKLYENGVIPASTSDAFWRKEVRLGRTIVDKANVVFSDTVLTSKGNVITVPSMVDLVEKKYNDKEALLKHLITMENQLRQSLQRETNLHNKLVATEVILDKEKAIRKKVQEQNIELQDLVFKLYRHLSDISIPKVKKKTDYAMKKIFSSPSAFFNEINLESEQNENVITVDMKKEQKKSLSSRFRKS